MSLRTYVETLVRLHMMRIEERFTAVEQATAQAFGNSQRAIDKADSATEKRFEGVNEFRAALSDQATKFVTMETLGAQIERMESNYRRNREDIDSLTNRMNIREGETAGSRLTYGNLAAMLGAASVIIGIIIVLANVLTN